MSSESPESADDEGESMFRELADNMRPHLTVEFEYERAQAAEHFGCHPREVYLDRVVTEDNEIELVWRQTRISKLEAFKDRIMAWILR